ncbi:MAG: aminopeptidase P family protein, partial [Haloferacaceae archaeon]
MTDPDDRPASAADAPDDRRSDPPADVGDVADAVAAADAVAFVHAGRAGDPDLRYLLRTPLPDEPCAYLLPRD